MTSKSRAAKRSCRPFRRKQSLKMDTLAQYRATAKTWYLTWPRGLIQWCWEVAITRRRSRWCLLPRTYQRPCWLKHPIAQRLQVKRGLKVRTLQLSRPRRYEQSSLVHQNRNSNSGIQIKTFLWAEVHLDQIQPIVNLLLYHKKTLMPSRASYLMPQTASVMIVTQPLTR